MYAVENPEVMATYCAMTRYSIALSVVDTTSTAQLKTTSILSCVANYKEEDDTIVLDDDVCCCLQVDATVMTLGPSLSRATEEEAAKDDEIQPDHDTPQVSTRSGRRSAKNKNSDFVFY